MKVIGIKGNYITNAEEPTSVYLMADSSLLKDGKPLFLPDFAERFTARPSLVVRINRLGKNIAKRFAPRYYDAVTVGLCIEASGLKDTSKLAEVCSITHSFDGSAVLGEFVPIKNLHIEGNEVFSVTLNEGDPITTRLCDMTMDIDSLIEELSKYYTFKIGDILFTGYGNKCFDLSINDTIIGNLGNTELLHFKVK